MSKMKSFSTGLSALALLAAAPAFAQVSAQELWDEWQALSALTGQTLAAESVTATSNGLVLTDVTTLNVQDDVRSHGRFSQITLTEQGDGTVAVGLSDLVTLTSTFDDEDGNPVDLILEIRHAGLDIAVSGPVEARQYEYSADSMTISTGDMVTSEGEPIDLSLDIGIDDLEARYLLDGSDPQNIAFTSTGSTGAVSALLDATAPEGEDGAIKISFAMTDMETTASGSVGALIAMSTTATGLPAGLEVDSRMTYGAMNYDVAFREDLSSFAMTVNNDGGSFAFALDKSAISYLMAGDDTSVDMQGTDIPFPISISADQTQIGFSLPLAAEPEPSDFALSLRYEGLEVGEAIWGMFDPGGNIARNPATLIVEATGTVQMFMDLVGTDLDELTAPPGELRSLTLDELSVSAGGAELTGAGAFQFPAGQPMPFPAGALNLELAGGFALLESLVASGLITAEDAAMGRAMGGMFARQVELDRLVSTIEFTAEGSVTANGIPLQ